MKRIVFLLLTLITVLVVTGCGAASKMAVNPGNTVNGPVLNNSKKVLIVYFSRAGENYQVGHIAKGNTHIMADMIASELKAPEFEIRPVIPYPEEYKKTTEIAKKEQEENARPALADTVPDWNDYDVIFLGYPIWWTDLPMPVYTFLESYDFSGKTVIPFATSAGDTLIGTEGTVIPEHAKGAQVAKGLGVEGKRLQDDPDSVRKQVVAWLGELGYGK